MSYIFDALVTSLQTTQAAADQVESLSGNFWVNLVHAITHSGDRYIGQPDVADDEAIIKARFDAIEKAIEAGTGKKASTFNPYRSAKSVINNAVKLGIVLNVNDTEGNLERDAESGMPVTRGKSEIQKAIKEAKERKSDATRIAECISAAMKVLDSDTREPLTKEDLEALKNQCADLFLRIGDELNLHISAA